MKGFTHESQHNESKEWYTPPEVFEMLRFPHFELDPASPGKDIVPWIPAEHHLTIREDGLAVPWHNRVWLNPPYGQDTESWLKKLWKHGNGIALVFARTDTLWFHTIATHADALCFMSSRIKFIKPDPNHLTLQGTPDMRRKGNAGCGSMLLAYGQECADILIGSNAGWCVDNRNQYERVR